jgi:hypothetical protein
MAQDASWAQRTTDDWQHEWQLTISCILQYCIHGPQHIPFVTSVLRKDGFLLEFVPPSFQADRQVVMAAVATSGSALQFASAALKEDKGIVLEAVRNDPFALEYAGTSCKVSDRVCSIHAPVPSQFIFHASSLCHACHFASLLQPNLSLVKSSTIDLWRTFNHR